jgi:threonylcarbamoyladenosine tRNA methylthiotransferase MtaB
MRRPHDVSRVQESVTALCRAVPGINLGADVIVGFPGETEQDFEATAALVRAQNLGYLHVFRFSPRSGTEAASFDDSIAAPVKRERSQALTALSRELSQRFVASQIGARVPVLVQQRRPGAGDEQRGLSDNYLPLCFAAADVRQAGPHWRLAVILTAQGRGPHPARLV